MKLLSVTNRSVRAAKCHAAWGFSLVEIMVGMVIGMLGIIVMMQLFSLTEGRKRTTTGAGDAQSAGAIALYGLQRDIRQAGYGVADVRLMGCNILLRAGVTLNAIAPVTINHASIPAGDPNTDTLLVVYGNSNSSPQGELIIDQASAATPPYTVAALASFVMGDRVLALPRTPTPCLNPTTLAQVTGVGTTVLAPAGDVGMGQGTLFNLGRGPKIMAYAIHRGNLTVCDYMTSNCASACTSTDGPAATAVGGSCNAAWIPIASNIVSMRAEYGHDVSVPMDAVVDTYDQATPATACGWAMVSALRLALVVRNSQFEKTVVTGGAPVWAGTTSATSVPINLTSEASWQNYRYKVYQTTVPLRNLSWLGVQSGC
jgi:type IV pilus assembly protein PilW